MILDVERYYKLGLTRTDSLENVSAFRSLPRSCPNPPRLQPDPAPPLVLGLVDLDAVLISFVLASYK